MSFRHQRDRGRRGTALIEFAMIAMLLFTLIFGVFELARLMLMYTTVANSARIGARAAIVHGGLSTSSASGTADDADIVDAVKNYAAAGTMNPDQLTVHVTYQPDPNDATGTKLLNGPGSIVQVSVSYPYSPNTFIPIGLVTLSSSTQGVITY